MITKTVKLPKMITKTENDSKYNRLMKEYINLGVWHTLEAAEKLLKKALKSNQQDFADMLTREIERKKKSKAFL